MSKLNQIGHQVRSSLLRDSSLARGMIVLVATVAAPAYADGLPSGGQVAAGSAVIGGGANSTTITQTSQNAVINWNGFSVAQGRQVVFDQPNAQAATLNRVTGNEASTIAGRIVSNGAVYLINPNGIAITKTGAVQTGGGFVASTLDMTDADFMAGNLRFTGNGASKTITNAGSISAGSGAYVALLGGAVANTGTISVPLGKLALGSGEKIALDLNGGNFLQVAVPTSLINGTDALIDNSGDIIVSGGVVHLNAAVVKDAVRQVINMSGSINADSAVGNGGTIMLIGGADTASMAGTVTVSGTLSARATGSAGNGGFIETSGEHLDLAGIEVSTLAANGEAGTWLIDPTDFVIASSGGDITGAALSSQLGNGNVVIKSNSGANTGIGDIHVYDIVNWSANKLTLDAYRNINIYSTLNATGTASFAGIVGDTTQTGVGTVNGELTFGWGSTGFSGKLNLASTAGFSLNGLAYTVITTLGSAGSTTGTDLQGINGALNGRYVLGADINASATSGWNSGAGFVALGMDGVGNNINNGNGFTGAFNGLGHTISGLTISTPLYNRTAFIGFAKSGSTISNLGMVGGSISGLGETGGIVGTNEGTIQYVFNTGTVTGSALGFNIGGIAGRNTGTVTHAYSTGAVSGTYNVGGIAGYQQGSGARIFNAFSTGAITSISTGVGGLLGSLMGGSVDTSYATGAVTSTDANTSSVGGLVGSASTGNTISNSFATGNVTAGANATLVGGLVGYVYGSVLTNVYATGNVTVGSGGERIGGLVGENAYIGSITNAYSSGVVSASGGTDVGALVGRKNGSASVNNSYWSTTANPSLAGIGSGTLNSGGGLSNSALMQSSNFSGWSMDTTGGQANVWRIYNGYTMPLLKAFLSPYYVQTNNGSIIVYDGTTHSVTVTNADISRDARVLGTLSTATASGRNAGTYNFGLNGLYSIQLGYDLIGGAALIINPAPITLTGISGSTKVYDGTTTATLSGTASITPFGSDVVNISGTGVGVFADKNAGTNKIVNVTGYTLSGPDAANYTLAGSGGITGTILAKSLTLTYTANRVENLYGDAAPVLTGTVTASGLTGGDTLASLGTAVWTTTATSSSNTGSYAIVGSGLSNGNYAINPVQAAINSTQYRITARPITIIVDSKTSVYGSAIPALTYTIGGSGLVNGNTLTGTLATTGRSTSNAGVYAITQGTLKASTNYSVTFTGANLTITPRALAITADAGTGIYGETIPSLTYRITGPGLINGDTLTGALATLGSASADVGTYAITLGTLSNPNYSIAYTGADYSITPRQITIIADTISNLYGSAVPALTYTVGGMGLANGDTLSGALATLGTASSNAGRYAITQGTLAASSNYTIDGYTGADLVIMPRPITVTYTADTAEVLFGQPFPTFTGSASVEGLVNGDTLADLGVANWTVTATGSSFAGDYMITGSGLANANYAITDEQAPGNAAAFTINPSGQSLTSFLPVIHVQSISDVANAAAQNDGAPIAATSESSGSGASGACLPAAVADDFRRSGKARVHGQQCATGRAAGR